MCLFGVVVFVRVSEAFPSLPVDLCRKLDARQLCRNRVPANTLPQTGLESIPPSALVRGCLSVRGTAHYPMSSNLVGSLMPHMRLVRLRVSLAYEEAACINVLAFYLFTF